MGHLDLIIIVCLFIICVINYIYFYIQNTEIRLYKYIKTGDIFIENEKFDADIIEEIMEVFDITAADYDFVKKKK